MANIMLTYRCNLRCSYCFANEFVGKESTDISLENFLKAVSFITSSGEPRIGLIGGEPTVHPGFRVIMDLLIANPKVQYIEVFTNGLLIDRFIEQLVHPKVDVCINCNSPDMIREKRMAAMPGSTCRITRIAAGAVSSWDSPFPYRRTGHPPRSTFFP